MQTTPKRLLASILGMSLTMPGFAADWQALPDKVADPADNPSSAAKIELGKTLYFDPRLSEHGTLSCNSCHNLMAAGDDNRPNSIGMHDARGGRSAPTVWNAAFYSVQFWDGRAASLEDQAKGPVVNPVEMGMGTLDVAINRLQRIPGYQAQFAAAFPGEAKPVTADNVAKAIAAFERTLITPDSPYDRYAKGDKTALNEQQVRGLDSFAALGCVFRTKPATDSDASRPPIPIDGGHRFRGMPATVPTDAGHPLRRA